MRHLKTFESHNNYEDFTETEAFVKPNVSYCIQLNEVHYNPTETKLVVKYNVIDTSEPIQLYYYFNYDGATSSSLGVDMFDKVKIDDIEISITDLDTSEGKYQFTTAGEHTVKYTLKDPTFVGVEFDQQTGTLIRIGAIFIECTSITSVEIPNSVTTIGGAAFEICENLISVIIPNSVVSIGNNAFGGCTSLTSVTIGNSVTNIGSEAFSWCTGLTSVTIPNSVTTIGSGAFSDCRGLTSVTIGNSVTSIGEGAFYSCNSLSSINIPDSVTSIGHDAFCDTNLDATTRAKITAINSSGICSPGIE